MSNKARGFSYLGLLFFVAISAAALAALGQAWSTAAQRERERELEFRGGEIARAIASYAAAADANANANANADPRVPTAYPTTVDDLLNDRRGIKTRHHLRRAYTDPFTGQADWVLIPEPANAKRFVGVHSRTDRVLLREKLDDGTAIRFARDWLFMARPPGSDDAQLPGSPPPPAAASAPFR